MVTMNVLEHCIEEAERFTKTVRLARLRLMREKTERMVVSKETAACRRASMDLTRALAELRRPG